MIFTYTADMSLTITNPRFKYFNFSETFFDRVINSKKNLTKLFNCYAFADELIDPVTVNYFTVSNRWFIHPGFNRIVGSIMHGRTDIKSIIFSQVPLENMQVIGYKVFQNLKPVTKDVPVVFSPYNALSPHLEYRSNIDRIDYYAGILNRVVMKMPNGDEFFIGHDRLEKTIYIEYDINLTLDKNICNMFNRVELDKKIFYMTNLEFLEERKRLKEQWYD